MPMLWSRLALIGWSVFRKCFTPDADITVILFFAGVGGFFAAGAGTGDFFADLVVFTFVVSTTPSLVGVKILVRFLIGVGVFAVN